MSNWVNTLEVGVAWALVDHQGGIGQIYIPTKDHGEAIGDFEDHWLDIMVGEPLAKSFRLNFPGERVLVPDTSNNQQSVKKKWRVTMLNTSTGSREVLMIPCANDALLVPGSDLVDLGSALWAPIVSDLEKMYRAPSQTDPGPMEVESIRFTGGE